MGFWLLIPGVGMGGGDQGVIVSGPFCVCAAQYYRAGATAAQYSRAGAVATDSYRAGAEATQGDCGCA